VENEERDSSSNPDSVGSTDSGTGTAVTRPSILCVSGWSEYCICFAFDTAGATFPFFPFPEEQHLQDLSPSRRRNQYRRKTAAPPAQRAQITIAAMATGGNEADSRLLGSMGTNVGRLTVLVEETRVVDLVKVVEVDFRVLEEAEEVDEAEPDKTEDVVFGREVG
jgi:hypothetical protein